MVNTNLIYGRHPVLEAFGAGRQFDKILIQKGISSDETNRIKSLARELGIPVQQVPVQKLNALTKKNHQGVVGFISLIPYYSVEDVLLKAYDEGKTPLFLILDRVSDVRNFGAIARTAEGTSVDAIIIPEKGSAMINADAMKTSAGALNHIQVCRVKKLEDAISYLKFNGLKILIADSKVTLTLDKIDFSMPLAIILGSEGQGVKPELLQLSDEQFKIPMMGHVDSFNVSVSAGMILYEVMRQRFK